MTINQRIAALREELKKHELTAYLVPSSDPHQSEYVAPHWQSRKWISGFTGSAGIAIVTLDHAGLWTDSRYFLQAEEELANSEVVLHKQKVPHAPEHIAWLKNSLPAGAVVACDGSLFSENQVDNLEKNLAEKDIALDTTRDLIDAIWADRPGLPDNPIFEHDLQFAGRNRPEKFMQIREIMETKGADYHLVTTLDDIAWIFNIRSNDVEFNPVSIAYAVIGYQTVYLFIDDKKVPAGLRAKLDTDQVQLKPYEQIGTFLRELSSGDTILVDPSKTNARLFDLIQEASVITGTTISTPLKAIKNETEISHLKNVMRKDGVALLKLYRWLEKTLQERSVPETEVADRLARFRSEQEHYHNESFAAIVGYQGNGAIVHYRAKPGTCAEIKPEGILLLDSGGQYTDGTTDITRTIALSTPTPEQKRNFTMVLKGHIGLAMLKFPTGTRGNQVEILARMHLWKDGLNYGHGTGHGVGFFLNVHEGPQAFGSGATAKAATVFEEGMFTSNEPGFYKTGEYGIRTENLVLAVKDRETEYGTFLKFDTVTLFPIDLHLIEMPLLTREEVDWLNDYHARVFEELSPLLDGDEKAWLEEKCRSI